MKTDGRSRDWKPEIAKNEDKQSRLEGMIEVEEEKEESEEGIKAKSSL